MAFDYLRTAEYKVGEKFSLQRVRHDVYENTGEELILPRDRNKSLRHEQLLNTTAVAISYRRHIIAMLAR